MSGDKEVRSGVSDRRNHARHDVFVLVRVSVHRSDGVTTVCQGNVANMSECGMLVDVPLDLYIGQTVKMVILTPGHDRQFVRDAVVRNRNGHRYGVQFAALNPDDCKFLEQFRSAQDFQSIPLSVEIVPDEN